MTGLWALIGGGGLVTALFGWLAHRSSVKAAHAEGYAAAQSAQASAALRTARAQADREAEVHIEEVDIEHTAEARHEAIDAAAMQGRGRPLTTDNVERARERLAKLQAEERARRGGS